MWKYSLYLRNFQFVYFCISLLMETMINGHPGIQKCEPIQIPMCGAMPYNMTKMPNHLHHSTQENALLASQPFDDLVKTNCSDHLLFFICAMFVPICTPAFHMEAIPPCRSVCEKSRYGCEPIMNKYNVTWPEQLNCDRLPEYDSGVCVSPEAIVTSMPTAKTGDESGGDNQNNGNDVSQHTDCNCAKPRKPSKSAFKKGNYDYAIVGQAVSTQRLDTDVVITHFTVSKVLKTGKVPLYPNKQYGLWTNSSCVCPKLSHNRDYLIIGYEDAPNGLILFLPSSLVARFSSKWDSKLQKWTKKGRRKRKKGKKCRKKKNRPDGSKRCKDRKNSNRSSPRSEKDKHRKRKKNRSTETNRSTKKKDRSNELINSR